MSFSDFLLKRRLHQQIHFDCFYENAERVRSFEWLCAESVLIPLFTYKYLAVNGCTARKKSNKNNNSDGGSE